MLSCILPEDYVDASFEKALNLWLTKANLSEAPSDVIEKHWTSPLSDGTFDQLITNLDMKNVKRFNAYQDPFGSAWLYVVPSKNLCLKLTDQQLRISLSLRLGARNTLAVVVNLLQRTDIMVFPLPEAWDVPGGTTTLIL